MYGAQVTYSVRSISSTSSAGVPQLALSCNGSQRELSGYGASPDKRITATIDLLFRHNFWCCSKLAQRSWLGPIRRLMYGEGVDARVLFLLVSLCASLDARWLSFYPKPNLEFVGDTLWRYIATMPLCYRLWSRTKDKFLPRCSCAKGSAGLSFMHAVMNRALPA